jgi:hypothetical protein
LKHENQLRPAQEDHVSVLQHGSFNALTVEQDGVSAKVLDSHDPFVHDDDGLAARYIRVIQTNITIVGSTDDGFGLFKLVKYLMVLAMDQSPIGIHRSLSSMVVSLDTGPEASSGWACTAQPKTPPVRRPSSITS